VAQRRKEKTAKTKHRALVCMYVHNAVLSGQNPGSSWYCLSPWWIPSQCCSMVGSCFSWLG